MVTKISSTEIKVLKPKSQSDGILEYEIPNGQTTVNANFYDEADDDMFHNAFGNLFKPSKAREQRRNLRTTSKAQERQASAKANVLAAQSLGKDSQSDVQMAKALQQTSKSKSEKGMSTGAKIGIGVAIAAVLGLATWFVIKKVKKGKK